jgi:DNA (cytosine-5)-methyltransferase 1
MGLRCANAQYADMNMLTKIDDYPVYLEAAWQQHLALRCENAPTVISLFAGCGGSSLGYSMAGYRELLAVEWNDNAVATFRLNFPDVPVYHGDIAKLSVAECMRLANVKEGELDVLDGSPPCQGFSTAGKRKFSDNRNQLFREYVRLLRGLHPKVFIMENVSGMVKGLMKLIFADIMRELKASGYRVSARLLNAMYFGVPQSRERMIFIGVREGLEIEPSHPKGATIPVTVRQALPHIFTIGSSNGFGEARQISSDRPYHTIGIAPQQGNGLARFVEAKIIHDTCGIFPCRDITNTPSVTLNINPSHWQVETEADISNFAIGDEYDNLIEGGKSKRFLSLVKAKTDAPSPTLTKSGATLSAASVVHLTEKRKFYSWELKCIGSFPDNFQLAGGYSDAWARIGNSVPPLFMRAIAEHVRHEILDAKRVTHE